MYDILNGRNEKQNKKKYFRNISQYIVNIYLFHFLTIYTRNTSLIEILWNPRITMSIFKQLKNVEAKEIVDK